MMAKSRRALGAIFATALVATLVPLSASSAQAEDEMDPGVFMNDSIPSNTSDGIFTTHSNSVTSVLIGTELELTRANVKMTSSNPAVLAVKESAFYLGLASNSTHSNLYLAVMYLKTGASAGVATISVTVTHPALSHDRTWSNKITVERVVGDVELLTAQSTRPTIFGSFRLVNSIASIAPGKAMTLRAYVNNNNLNGKSASGEEGLVIDYDASFDNVALIPAKKVKWTKGAPDVKKDKKAVYFTLAKNGKITAKKTMKGAIYVTLTATYKGASRDFSLNKLSGKDVNVKSLYQAKPARTWLQRGEKRVSDAGYGPVLGLAESTKKVTWASSSKKVASVNSVGVITAKQLGKFKLTAKLGKKKASVTYRVVTLETFAKKYYKFSNTTKLGGTWELQADKTLRERWAS
jgi:hypothetical protein